MNDIKLIITMVLFGVMIISFLGLKIVQKKHLNDPEYQKKQQELAAEYRRKQQEDEELNDIAMSMGDSYEDDY